MAVDAFVEAQELHGKTTVDSTDLVAKLRLKNTKKQKETVDSYVDKYKDHEGNVEQRRENYAGMVNNFYDLVTDFYEYGWGQCFHFCRFYKGEAFDQAIARHEHYLASKLQLTPGQKVLDVGCGIGGPMREIARFSGASVVGINNNAYQVDRVAMFNKKAGLEKIASAVKGDFMQMPMEDETFDAVYSIEATCHAPSLQGVYSEVFRVLKPGGYYASYEWCRTESYNDNNREHKRIIEAIEEGNSLPHMATTAECLEAFQAAGFEIIEYEDLAPFDPRYEEPWYSTLQGSSSLSGFRMTRLGRWTTDKMVLGLETIGLAPKGSRRVSQLLNMAADYLVDGGVKNIFTPMFFVLVRKPLN